MHTNRIARLAIGLAAAVLLAACSGRSTPAPLATQLLDQLQPGADIQASLTPTSRPPRASPSDTAEPSATPRPPTATPVPPSDTAKPSDTPAPPPPPPANCDPSYPDFCIPPPPPDLDCGDISRKRFTVLQPDPHNFDADKDGVGCES